MAIVEEQVRDWEITWKCESKVEGPWRHDKSGQITPLTGDDIACSHEGFKEYTATATDALHPRSYGNASPEITESTAVLLNACERAGTWPTQVSELHVPLLNKPDGSGKRPITLQPSLLRVWERARVGLVKEWMTAHARDYDYACEGRSGEEAMWWLLLTQEGYEDYGESDHTRTMATLLLDIRKCFDTTGCDQIWRWGRHHGFPHVILRMVLLTFELPRRLVAEGSFGRRVQTSWAMVAGSCFSIALLHAMMLTPCDTLVRNMGNLQGVQVGVMKYVDDLTITVEGPLRLCRDAVWKAFDEVKTRFSDLGWALSLNKETAQGKTVALTTNTALAEMLQKPAGRRGVRVVQHARGLGVDLSARGSRVRASVQVKRVRAVNARKAKIRLAKKHGGETRKVGRGGLTPQATYGMKCLMATPQERAKVRAAVNFTEVGKTHSCSRALRLAAGGLEPTHDMLSAPLFMWACVVWEHGVVPKARLAWLRHRDTTSWEEVRGPAASVSMITQELGWRWPDPGVFYTRDGYRVDLRHVAPRDVQRQARLDSEAAMWDRWCQAQDGALGSLAPRPFIDPIREWFKKRKIGPGTHLARQAVCGGQWMQQ